MARVRYCFSPPQDGDPSGTAGCPSGQRERSVKSSAEAYVGSNPTPATVQKLASDKDGMLVSPDQIPVVLRHSSALLDCAGFGPALALPGQSVQEVNGGS
jgi:hypothetical protein